MIRTLIQSLGIGVICAPMLLAQAEGPTLQPLWTLTSDFASPESAYYHAGSNSIFVSSINGQILEKDGNGYISRLSPDGKMVSAQWVDRTQRAQGHSKPGRHALGDRHRRGRLDRHRDRAHYRARQSRWRSVPQRSGDGAGRNRLRIGLEPGAYLRSQRWQVIGLRRRRRSG